MIGHVVDALVLPTSPASPSSLARQSFARARAAARLLLGCDPLLPEIDWELALGDYPGGARSPADADGDAVMGPSGGLSLGAALLIHGAHFRMRRGVYATGGVSERGDAESLLPRIPGRREHAALASKVRALLASPGGGHNAAVLITGADADAAVLRCSCPEGTSARLRVETAATLWEAAHWLVEEPYSSYLTRFSIEPLAAPAWTSPIAGTVAEAEACVQALLPVAAAPDAPRQVCFLVPAMDGTTLAWMQRALVGRLAAATSDGGPYERRIAVWLGPDALTACLVGPGVGRRLVERLGSDLLPSMESGRSAQAVTQARRAWVGHGLAAGYLAVATVCSPGHGLGPAPVLTAPAAARILGSLGTLDAGDSGSRPRLLLLVSLGGPGLPPTWAGALGAHDVAVVDLRQQLPNGGEPLASVTEWRPDA